MSLSLDRLARRAVLSLGLAVLVLPRSAPAQQPEFDVRANYVKREYMVAMRDGVRLYTIVNTPRDQTQNPDPR
jgi:predicted acyl esterase